MQPPSSTSLCVCTAHWLQLLSQTSPAWAILLPKGERAEMCPSIQPSILARGSSSMGICVCTWEKIEGHPAPYWDHDGTGIKPVQHLSQSTDAENHPSCMILSPSCLHKQPNEFPPMFDKAKRVCFSKYVWLPQVVSMSSAQTSGLGPQTPTGFLCALESESGPPFPLLLLHALRVSSSLMS